MVPDDRDMNAGLLTNSIQLRCDEGRVHVDELDFHTVALDRVRALWERMN